MVVFFDVFFRVSGASITKESVVLIQYLLCSKGTVLSTSTFLKKGENVYKFDTFSRTHLGAALGVDFRRIWGRFWELLGTLKAPKYGKRGVQKTVEKQDLKKLAKSHAGRKLSCGPRPCAPLKEPSRTADSRPTGPDLQDTGPVFGTRGTPLRALRARWRISSKALSSALGHAGF